MPEFTREQLIQDLRDAADFFEQHPEVRLPQQVSIGQYSYGNQEGREDVQTFIRAIGKVRKDYSTSATQFWAWAWEDRAVSFHYGCSREAVCRRVVKGTRIVPAQPAREEEIVEWECGPVLETQNENSRSQDEHSNENESGPESEEFQEI
jgi:hypothetical protein